MVVVDRSRRLRLCTGAVAVRSSYVDCDKSLSVGFVPLLMGGGLRRNGGYRVIDQQPPLRGSDAAPLLDTSRAQTRQGGDN